MVSEPDTASFPALKNMFDAGRFADVAALLAAIESGFDQRRFVKLALHELDSLSLMQRLRRMTECLRATLPDDYRRAIAILKILAPQIGHGFVVMALSDYVALYGHGDFDRSMKALKFFTRFGSSEFAVREFLRRDLKRTLAVMESWSGDADEAVRRLASEGSRPRLPWSFRLEALIADPTPVAGILENLRADASLYVRKSVANHLNDIAKDHPQWVLARIASWPLENAHTAWIAKRGLLTLIKEGQRDALAVIGAGAAAQVRGVRLSASPRALCLGERLELSLRLKSVATTAQRLVIDYAIHYVKKAGGTSAKVFKWKEVSLAPGESLELSRSQMVRNFTTRVHYPGRHVVELLINGSVHAKTAFDILP